jgi:flagellar hook assembly protein FlgD
VYPNPFNPLTRIEYALAEPGRVVVRVYNLAGRRVATLVDGTVGAGGHTAVWDGATDSGDRAASGVYFIRMEAGGFRGSEKLVLLK